MILYHKIALKAMREFLQHTTLHELHLWHQGATVFLMDSSLPSGIRPAPPPLRSQTRRAMQGSYLCSPDS